MGQARPQTRSCTVTKEWEDGRSDREQHLNMVR